MKLRYLFLLAALTVTSFTPASFGEDARPAGYIMSYELKGADAEEGTVIARDGSELRPKLLMPLYEDDAVFVRDGASKVILNLAHGGAVTVDGASPRKEIAGEMPSGDDSFNIIKQIAGIFAGGDDDSFSTLVSKGPGELKAPMAVRGRNYLRRGGKPIWISWTGGKAPFRISVEVDKKQTALISQDARETEIAIPPDVKKRFTVIVTDSRKTKRRIFYELRESLPEVPENIKKRENDGEVIAVWLAGREQGAWRFEAARMLRDLPGSNKTAEALLEALAKGWIPD